MRRLRIISCSTPDEPGYRDHAVLYNCIGNMVWQGYMSICPNPFSPKGQKPWQNVYGWMEAGEYKGQCVKHPKYGKCIYIGKVGTRNPNANHDGQYIMTEVFIHQGGFRCKNPEWRGSAGCPTMHKNEWKAFISCFHDGERLEIKIVDGITQVKAQFYKGGKKGTRFTGWLIRRWTRSEFEHVELDFGKFSSFGSSGYDGGCRWKQIDYKKHSERWTAVKLKKNPSEIHDMILHCDKHYNNKYDYCAIFFWHFLPFRRQNPRKWYCSELVAHILGIKPEQVSPGKLYAMIA